MCVRLHSYLIRKARLCAVRVFLFGLTKDGIDTWQTKMVLPTFGVMGNMLSSHKRLEDATTSAASGQ